MIAEQDKILKALEVAIGMENEGKECYLQASRESGNEVGKQLLQTLALEEDHLHLERIIWRY
jgi:rubrerythrin